MPRLWVMMGTMLALLAGAAEEGGPIAGTDVDHEIGGRTVVRSEFPRCAVEGDEQRVAVEVEAPAS